MMITGKLMMIKNVGDETLDKRTGDVNRFIKMVLTGDLPVKVKGDKRLIEAKLELKIYPGEHDHDEIKKALKLEEHGDKIEINLMTLENRAEDGIFVAVDEKRKVSSYFKK